MKKYGDDADSFHDQGTRVEASKRWHEQNQLRHNYSYSSPVRPRHSYKPKYRPKHTSKPKSNYKLNNKDTYKWEKCPKCKNTYNKNLYWKCPYCKGIKPKSIHKANTKNISNFITCPICNNQYNANLYLRCPHCKKKTESKSTHNPNDWLNHKKLGHYDVMCAKCDFIYDTRFHGSCPNCGRVPNRMPPTRKEDSTTVMVLMIILILLIILYAISSL